MVNLTRIYTRTGDDGTTNLVDFSRTSKNDLRLVAYADVDEANSQLGLALSFDELEDDVVRIVRHVQNSFILPGGTRSASALHVARTVTRRAERSAWAAIEVHGPTMNPLTARYLNRLSDLLFILGRYANREVGDVLWVPGGER